jgi:asparagine synthase (glutamine-hydrolysing)
LNAYLAALLLQYLPDDILTKVDRMSSAHSIEARVPLLDHRVVELAARIPPELKLKGPHSKHILRRAMAARLPESVLTRDKRGFGVPLSYLEGSACRERLEELRTRCRALEEVINFSDMERWDSLFTWRVLCLASWLARQ